MKKIVRNYYLHQGVIRFLLYTLLYVLYSITTINYLLYANTPISIDTLFFYCNNELNEYGILGAILILIVCGDYSVSTKEQRSIAESIIKKNETISIIKMQFSCTFISLSTIAMQITGGVIASLIKGHNPFYFEDNILFLQTLTIVLLRITAITQFILLINILTKKFWGALIFILISLSEFIGYELLSATQNLEVFYFLPFAHSIIIYNPNVLLNYIRPDFWISCIYWFAILLIFYALFRLLGVLYKKRVKVI